MSQIPHSSIIHDACTNVSLSSLQVSLLRSFNVDIESTIRISNYRSRNINLRNSRMGPDEDACGLLKLSNYLLQPLAAMPIGLTSVKHHIMERRRRGIVIPRSKRICYYCPDGRRLNDVTADKGALDFVIVRFVFEVRVKAVARFCMKSQHCLCLFNEL